MNGFTYNGIHCSAYGVYYIPDASDRWYEDPEFENYQKDVTWKNGGYHYGNAVKIRTISIKCYFEEIDIATREKIRKWLKRDTSGQLIFDDKPFVYYNVRPSAVIPGKIYNDNNESYSGTFEIKFTAEDPFGYLTRKYNMSPAPDNASDYCGIIRGDEDAPIEPSTSGTYFTVYNPGTEDCGLSVVLAGSCSNPFRLFNQRNGSQCVISSLPSNGIYLDIDGDTGNVIAYANSPEIDAGNGFAYHDHGFIMLSPCDHFESHDYSVGNINLYNPTTRKADIEGRTDTTYQLSAYLGVDTGSSDFLSAEVLYQNGEYESMTVETSSIYNQSAGDRISMTINISQSDGTPLSIGLYSSDISDFQLYNIQIEAGNTVTPYIPYIAEGHIVKLNDMDVTEDMIGGRVVQRSQNLSRYASILAINKENNLLILSSEPWQPYMSYLYIYTENLIVIEEQNQSGNWVTPTTVSLSHISVDFKPRLL